MVWWGETGVVVDGFGGRTGIILLCCVCWDFFVAVILLWDCVTMGLICDSFGLSYWFIQYGASNDGFNGNETLRITTSPECKEFSMKWTAIKPKGGGDRLKPNRVEDKLGIRRRDWKYSELQKCVQKCGL